MQVGLSLWFDQHLEGEVRGLWSELKQQQIPSELYSGLYRPHITIGVWDFSGLDALIADLSELCKEISTFAITFESTGIFPGDEGVAFLAPVVTSRLLEVHRQISLIGDRHGNAASQHYRPDSWVPHCTVAWRAPSTEILRAAGICTACKLLPLRGAVTRLGVIQTPEEIELSEIFLSGNLEHN